MTFGTIFGSNGDMSDHLEHNSKFSMPYEHISWTHKSRQLCVYETYPPTHADTQRERERPAFHNSFFYFDIMLFSEAMLVRMSCNPQQNLIKRLNRKPL